MYQKIITILILIFYSTGVCAQTNSEIIKKIIEYENKKDVEGLKKYFVKDFKVKYDEDQIFDGLEIIEDEIMQNTIFSDVEILKETEDLVVINVTKSNDYRELMEYHPFTEKQTYFFAGNKIKKITVEIDNSKNKRIERQEDYEKQRAFELWLAKQNILDTDLYDTELGSTLEIKIAKLYKNKELSLKDKNKINQFITDLNQKRKSDFTANDFMDYKKFCYKVLMAYKNKDYTEFLKLYITEKEFIDIWKYYGVSALYGKHEYNENVRIMSKERFDYISGLKFHSESAIFEFAEEIEINPKPFSKTFYKEKLKDKPEYYFLKERIQMKFLYNSYDSIEKSVNLAEIIYIPNKGWRLTNLH